MLLRPSVREQGGVEDPTLVRVALGRDTVVIVPPSVGPRRLHGAQERVERVCRRVPTSSLSHERSTSTTKPYAPLRAPDRSPATSASRAASLRPCLLSASACSSRGRGSGGRRRQGRPRRPRGRPRSAAGLDAHSGGEQARRPLVEHLAHRHPEEHHRAAGAAPAVRQAVAVLAPRGPEGHVRPYSGFEPFLGEPGTSPT